MKILHVVGFHIYHSINNQKPRIGKFIAITDSFSTFIKNSRELGLQEELVGEQQRNSAQETRKASVGKGCTPHASLSHHPRTSR